MSFAIPSHTCTPASASFNRPPTVAPSLPELPPPGPLATFAPPPLSQPLASRPPAPTMEPTREQFSPESPLYYNLPEDAPALLSTDAGTKPKRKLPQPPPAPIAHSDFYGDIARTIYRLRQKFPEITDSITRVDHWTDLYHYFDAVDLWLDGANFCFNVVHQIAVQNNECDKDIKAMIYDFAIEWTADNQGAVGNLPVGVAVSTLFNQDARDNCVDMKPKELEYLDQCLEHFRRQVLERMANQPVIPALPLAQPIQHMMDRAPMMPPPGHVVLHPCFPPVPGRVPGGENPNPLHIHGPPPIAHQPYTRFNDDHQRNLDSGPKSVLSTPRDRGYSNASVHSGRGYNTIGKGRNNAKFYQGNGRNANNPPLRGTPPKHPAAGEPLYMLRSPPFMSQNAGNNYRPTGGVSQPAAATYSPTFHRTSSISNGRGLNNSDISKRDILSKSGTVPNDVRLQVPIATDFFNPETQIQTASTGAITYHYLHPAAPILSDDTSARTVFVGGASYEFFRTHDLRSLMSSVGDVEHISYVPNSQCAFVGFIAPSSVDLAIRDLNDHLLPSGKRLTVKYPNKRHRSGSQSSQSSSRWVFSGHRASSQHLEHNGNNAQNRPFLRNFQHPSQRTHLSVPHSRKPSGASLATSNSHHNRASGVFSGTMAENIVSRAAEVIQHQQAMSRFGGPQVLLDRQPGMNHVNLPYHFKGNKTMEDSLASPFSNKKENSPMASPSKNSTKHHQGKNKKKNGGRNTSAQPTPSGSPSKTSRVSGKEKQTESKKKESGQNASVQPTPVASPSRQRGVSSKDNKVEGKVEENKQSVCENHTLSLGPSRPKSQPAEEKQGEVSQPRKNKNKAKRKPASFQCESSTARSNSPADTPSGEDTMASGSTNTSFSTAPSRKPSHDSIVLGEEDAGSLGKGLENNAAISIEMPDEDMVNGLPSQSDFNKNAATKQEDTTPVNKKSPSHKARRSTRNSDVKPSAEVSDECTSSVEKSETKSPVKTASNRASKSTSEKREADKEELSSPWLEINLNDNTEFPSLGPAKSPVSSIADGKRPPPPTIRAPPFGGALERNGDKDGNKKVRPAVPAVAIPRAYKPRSQS